MPKSLDIGSTFPGKVQRKGLKENKLFPAGQIHLHLVKQIFRFFQFRKEQNLTSTIINCLVLAFFTPIFAGFCLLGVFICLKT